MNAMNTGLAKVIVEAESRGDAVYWNYALMCAKGAGIDGIADINKARRSGDMDAYVAARDSLVEQAREVLATDSLALVRDDIEMAVLTTDPSRYALGKYADRIDAIGSESPYAQIAVDALRRGDAQTGLGMVQAAARA